jgi:hypothetical protein
MNKEMQGLINMTEQKQTLKYRQLSQYYRIGSTGVVFIAHLP